MNTSNSELVSAIVAGEIQRYGEVVRRFDERVRHVICKSIEDPATREDLVQETFYRAFTKLDNIRDADQLESWLTTIARNCLTDHFRNSKRRGQKETLGGLRTIVNHEANRKNTQASAWIWQEVDQLPESFSEVLRLRYRQSMSYLEIATKLGLSESTVRGRIFEARKSLRQRLLDNRLFP